MKISIVGLGTMGGPIASNLLKAGFEVTVHNRTRSKEKMLEQLGAIRAESPVAAATEAEIYLTCVSDTPDVESVLLDPSQGAINVLQPNSLVIDCSSISPEATRRIAQKLRAKNVGFVDAPVSGGVEGAIQGTLAIMCGGTEEDIERSRPVLHVIGNRITHIGPVGCGQIAKMTNQVVITGTFMALAEALTLSSRAGANPERVIEAMSGGTASSWILNNRSQKMLNNDYTLGFKLRLHRKDLGIALALANEYKVPLPVARLVTDIEDKLIAQGYGDEDMSNLVRFVRQEAGILDKPMEN